MHHIGKNQAIMMLESAADRMIRGIAGTGPPGTTSSRLERIAGQPRNPVGSIP